MEEERINYMMKRINDYIQGRFNNEEEDQLWIEFLKDPHWFNIFQIELNLTHLFKHAERDLKPFF